MVENRGRRGKQGSLVALVCCPGPEATVVAPVRLWTDAIKVGRNDEEETLTMACFRKVSKLLYEYETKTKKGVPLGERAAAKG